MAGLGIRLYTDEMIDIRVARALRGLGYDVESCQEAGRSNQGISDEAQLQYATAEGRAIFTFNFIDYLQLDALWKSSSQRHAGIIVSAEIRDLGTLLRRVAGHLDRYAPAEQNDVVLWLSATPGA
ncbi:MAG TPA: DUF5615 family PIN-like protein [Chloroflexota bacterium]|nr:DUF5615 family PIN-like protein [Chloroflexota bacterium]